MLQILGTLGYKCNRLRHLLQNSFENVELPVRVENRTGLLLLNDYLKLKLEGIIQIIYIHSYLYVVLFLMKLRMFSIYNKANASSFKVRIIQTASNAKLEKKNLWEIFDLPGGII